MRWERLEPTGGAALDWALLRAGLRAAQAATPTARAQRGLAGSEPRDRSAGLLGRAAAGSFHPPAAMVSAPFTVRFQPSLNGDGPGEAGGAAYARASGVEEQP